MPIPFLLAGAAAVAGTAGIVKGAKAIQNNAEAKELLEKASLLCETAKNSFETQKEKTTTGLQTLGNIKIDAWSSGVESFVREFSCFKNVRINDQLNLSADLKYNGGEPPAHQLINMQNAALTAKEIVKIGAVSLGAGAVVGIALYGGVMMFGKASTGAAISALSGVAAKNATLAWLGGGAISSGGLGMAGGKLLLGGVMVAPVLAVAGYILEAKSREKLANAKMVYAEAEESAEKIDMMTSYMKGIEGVSSDYADFIKKFGKKYQPFINELRKIRNGKSVDANGRIDFNSLSEAEQKTLHLSWLMAQIYYQLLTAPILNQNGEITREARPALENAQSALRGLEKQTFKMSGAAAPAANLVWRRKSAFILAANFFVVGLLVALGVLLLKVSVLKAVLLFADAFVAFPVFVVFRDLPASKRYVWRIIRLVLAVILMLLVLIFV